MIIQPSDLAALAVLIVEERRFRSLRSDPDLVDLVDDPEVLVMPFSHETAENRDVAERLRAQQLWRPGTLALRSPYNPERYVAADLAVGDFTVEKFFLLTELAAILGAKSVKIESITAKSDAAQRNSRTRVKGLHASAELNVAGAVEKELEERLVTESSFSGASPDVDAARGLLSKRSLLGDPQLLSLVQLRSGENALMSQRVRVSAARESRSTLDVAVRLAGGKGKLKLVEVSEEVQLQWRSSFRVDVTTSVEF